MHSAVRHLYKRLTTKGKFKRGALSRASEYLDLSRTTLRRIFAGEWKPGKETLENIKRLAKDDTASFEPMKPGPRVGQN